MEDSKLLKTISWNPILAGLAICNFCVSMIINDSDAFPVWEMIIYGEYNVFISLFVFGLFLCTVGIAIRKDAIWSLYSFALINVVFCCALSVLGLLQLYHVILDGLDSEFTIFFSAYLVGISYLVMQLMLLVPIIRERRP